MNTPPKPFFVFIKFVGGDSIRADYSEEREMRRTMDNLVQNPGARWMSFERHMINLDNVTTVECGKS